MWGVGGGGWLWVALLLLGEERGLGGRGFGGRLRGWVQVGGTISARPDAAASMILVTCVYPLCFKSPLLP